MTPDARPTSPAPSKKLRCRVQGTLAEWLDRSGGSLAVTTYTSGKLIFVSSFGGRLHFRTQRFARPMGLALAGNQLGLAIRKQVLLFQSRHGKPGTFALRSSYNTGKVDAHDVALGQRRVYFANTRFNCVARTSVNKHFTHCWQPEFIEGLVREDRCHLNGLALEAGQPKFATAFCATGHTGGWREQNRFTSGVLLDIQANRTVAEGLCMPHSPRYHQGQLWLCNSGHGLLVTVDLESGKCQEICSLPGFTRGLSFWGDHALVGLSRIRRKHILDAPPVRRRQKSLFAGIALVNCRTGKHVGSLEFLDGGREVYDVIFLSGRKRPRLVLPQTIPTKD